jgi:hypothetical protein
MAQITRLEGFRVPLGGQEIELQQIDYDGGGMSLLRIRIREGSRFTVFDIDPSTARQWAEAMARWAAGQPAIAGQGDGGAAGNA